MLQRMRMSPAEADRLKVASVTECVFSHKYGLKYELASEKWPAKCG